MSDWRERILGKTSAELDEHSAENMAAHRIMKSMGASVKEIGNLCRHFNLPYNEDETTFQRAVSIFREVYENARAVDVFDVRAGAGLGFATDFMSDPRSAVLFFRINGGNGREARMTAFVRGRNLTTSPLGQIVIKPGIRYVDCRDGVQLWEQDPVTLLRSFKKEGG